MKHYFTFAASASLLFVLSFCKNTPLPDPQAPLSTETAATPPTPLPAKKDSMVGYKGCERATWSPVSANTEEFVYQHFTIRITRTPGRSGEQILVMPDSGRLEFPISVSDDARFFGACRNKIFVDEGTGLDGRKFFVFDVDKMVQSFSSPYCGEVEVIHSEKLYFMQPVEESEVRRIPDCPEKEEWLGKGLRVGYGQRCIFNFMRRSLVRKSEWACVAMQ